MRSPSLKGSGQILLAMVDYFENGRQMKSKGVVKA